MVVRWGESWGLSFAFTAHVLSITSKKERKRKEKNRWEERETERKREIEKKREKEREGKAVHCSCGFF